MDKKPSQNIKETSLAVRAGYDAAAAAYARTLNHELDGKPFDRVMLDWLAARVASGGVVCDMGCGPGQIAHYLQKRGLRTCGIDLSPGMIAEARALNPGIPFDEGDMLSLERVPDNAYAGLAAFYSIVNIPPPHHPQVFREWARILAPGGVVLLSFHIGEGFVHLDELFGARTSLDFYFCQIAAVKTGLDSSGLIVTEVMTREPYPAGEAATTRGYIFAEKRIPKPDTTPS